MIVWWCIFQITNILFTNFFFVPPQIVPSISLTCRFLFTSTENLHPGSHISFIIAKSYILHIVLLPLIKLLTLLIPVICIFYEIPFGIHNGISLSECMIIIRVFIWLVRLQQFVFIEKTLMTVFMWLCYGSGFAKFGNVLMFILYP